MARKGQREAKTRRTWRNCGAPSAILVTGEVIWIARRALIEWAAVREIGRLFCLWGSPEGGPCRAIERPATRRRRGERTTRSS